jgi:hypothetical protein
MQAIRAGRGPLTLIALLTFALGSAQLLPRPERPKAVDTVVHVELRSAPAPAPRNTHCTCMPPKPPPPPPPCKCIKPKPTRPLTAKAAAATTPHR